MRRTPADSVDGVLALDKPPGISSSLAVQKARRLLQARKAGHTGTLDPLASGLLALTLGEATKFSADLLEADKEYEAQIELGAVTTTGDAEGEVLRRCAAAVGREQFEQALTRFVGAGVQVPPMHSALKHQGRPLYELARLGQEVEREPRPIVISRLRLVHWDPERPLVEVACSKGTYVRVLAQDIGAALGCGAHLHRLRRTRVGHLRLEQAVTLAALEALEPAGRRALLLPVDSLLGTLPSVALDRASAERFGHGQPIAHAGDWPRVRVYEAGGALLGVARCGGGWLEATRLVAQPEPNAGAAIVAAGHAAGIAAGRMTDEFGIEEAR